MATVLEVLRSAGFTVPRYDGNNIVNLLASIITAKGGRSPFPGLKADDTSDWAAYPRIVYVVIDGLGVSQLRRFLSEDGGGSFWGRYPYVVLESVCPATTAAAVTSFATGLAPSEHAILGWHLLLPDLGLVSTILPAITRTEVPIAPPEFDLKRYLGIESRLSSITAKKFLISYHHLPRSRYSLAVGEWDRRFSYRTLKGFVRAVITGVRAARRSVIYAYWPFYDSTCHQYGCYHRRSVAHLRGLDEALSRLVRHLRGTSTLLLVTADHGLVDTPQTLDLMKLKEISRCFSILPSGDARQMHCFLRPHAVRDFDEFLRTKLDGICVSVEGRELMMADAFGPSERAHPSLLQRIGDRVIFPLKGWAIGASVPYGEYKFNKANHGGLSEDEVLVPLYVVRT